MKFKIFSLLLLSATIANGAPSLGSGTSLGPTAGTSTNTVLSLATNATGVSLVNSNSVTPGTNWLQMSVAAASGAPLDIMTRFYSKPARFGNTYWYVRSMSTNANTALLQAWVDVWKTNGMLAAGYDLIWVDDDWAATNRQGDGTIIADSTLYSGGTSGFSNVCYYAHTNGFRFGAYVGLNGTTTSGRAVGGTSWQRDMLDATYLVRDIGIDALKLDSTSPWDISSPYLNRNSGEVMQLRSWMDALLGLGKPIQTIASGYPYSSGWYGYTPAGNSAPASFLNGEWLVNSIQNAQASASMTFTNWFFNYTNAIPHMYVTRPGSSIQLSDIPANRMGSNMLKAALTLTYLASSDSQISEAFPTNGALLYLTNRDAMSIGNDLAWIPATNYILNTYPMFAWNKYLGRYNGESNAVGMVNFSSSNYTYTVYDTNMGWPSGSVFTVHDCWTLADIADYTNSFTYVLSSSNSALLRVSRKQFRNGTEIAQNTIVPDALVGASYTPGAFPVTAISNIFAVKGSGGTATFRTYARDSDVAGFYLYSTAAVTHMGDILTGLDFATVVANAEPHNANFLYTLSASRALGLKTNTLANWPSTPIVAGVGQGGFVIVSSNGYPYILFSTNGAIGSVTWTGTNKLSW